MTVLDDITRKPDFATVCYWMTIFGELVLEAHKAEYLNLPEDDNPMDYVAFKADITKLCNDFLKAKYEDGRISLK